LGQECTPCRGSGRSAVPLRTGVAPSSKFAVSFTALWQSSQREVCCQQGHAEGFPEDAPDGSLCPSMTTNAQSLHLNTGLENAYVAEE
jgi:hypothetical protein